QISAVHDAKLLAKVNEGIPDTPGALVRQRALNALETGEEGEKSALLKHQVVFEPFQVMVMRPNVVYAAFAHLPQVRSDALHIRPEPHDLTACRLIVVRAAQERFRSADAEVLAFDVDGRTTLNHARVPYHKSVFGVGNDLAVPPEADPNFVFVGFEGLGSPMPFLRDGLFRRKSQSLSMRIDDLP